MTESTVKITHINQNLLLFLRASRTEAEQDGLLIIIDRGCTGIV